MEIKQIRDFRAIVDAGGLTKAAGLLRVTPGALSKALRHFEDELGKSLFHRSGRALTLTDDGRRLYHVSARLLDEHHRVLRSLDASLPAANAPVRLASFEVFTTHCLGAAAELGLDESPLHVLEMPPGAIERAVEAHEVDAGITYAAAPHATLTYHRIAKIDFGIFARKGAFGSDTAFDTLPFAVPTASIQLASQDILGIDCWPYERVPRLVKYRLTSLECALELVRRGRCVVFLPRFIAGLHNATVRPGLRLVQMRAPPRLRRVRRDVHVVTRAELRDAPAALAVANAIQAAIADGQARVG